MLNCFIAHSSKLLLNKNCSLAEIDRIRRCVECDNPLIGFLSPTQQYIEVAGIVEELFFEYRLSQKLQKGVNKDIDAQIDRIVVYSNQYNDDLDRVRAAHDYFCQMDYDYDFKPYSFTPAGSLLYGKSVCKGISLAFKAVLDKLKIPCVAVFGTHEGEGHAWNFVFCNGKWRHMDVTFDMCFSDNQNTSYRYFDTPSELLTDYKSTIFNLD